MTAAEQLATLDQANLSTVEKGRRFEAFVQAYLQQGYYARPFRWVQRWADWAAEQEGIGARDVGIDLAAEDVDGQRWAIQCKHWQRPVDWDDLSTFIALARSPRLAFDALLVVAPQGLTARAAEQCHAQGIAVLTEAELTRAPVDWPTFQWSAPAALTPVAPVQLRPYQEEALARIRDGWAGADRGKCIMPPGTGKTLVALRAVEAQAGRGSLVLFCAPSIALVNQTILAWRRDATLPLRFVAVASDTTIGREGPEDPDTAALIVPPTTDAQHLARAARPVPDALTVVVSTYQSLPVVAAAHALGLPPFAVAVADEAHRTTGVLAADEAAPSAFLLFHDADQLRAAKRLYLTATPRVFTEGLKTKLEQAGAVAVSMDDPDRFGPEFFRYPFWRGVEEGYLARYRVVVLAISETATHRRFVDWLQEADAPSVPDLVRVEGLWNTLHRPDVTGPLRRIIAFVNSVARSKRLTKDFTERAHRAGTDGPLTYAIAHMDGTMPMRERARLLRQLEDPPAGTGFVLTNARVLTEGIDVPALDAVVFLEPRASQVEVIQAVGRVMRLPPDRPDKVGYIVVPVVLPGDADPQSLDQVAAHLLAQDARFRPLLQILNALRSLDEGADVRIRHLIGPDGKPAPGGRDDVVTFLADPALPESLAEALRQALVPKIAERVDNPHYFAAFADTITEVARHLRTQLATAVQGPGSEAAAAFDAYHAALRNVLHPNIAAADAQDFLVQHWILAPVFGAIFPGDDLTASPVASAFDQVTGAFDAFLRRERAALEEFYLRVGLRAEGLRNDAERQDFLRSLFETLFKGAFPAAAERLGIVYTPVELVDFLIASADVLLQRHFGKTLADAGVTVIDPFAGTGTFPARVLARWDPAAIHRKLAIRELWANDIQLFAYYLLLTNLRWTVRERTGTDPGWDLPVLWADSFQLMEEHHTFYTSFFAEEYGALLTAQREAPITVVLANPPWRTGQRSQNDANKGVRYRRLDDRIRTTYVVRSTAGLKRNLYDAYVRAFRWASDRVGSQGVIGFVTNSGWIAGNAMDGLRKALPDEFVAIYVINLRGNKRAAIRGHDREGAKREGESTFPIQAGTALVLLVKDNSHVGPRNIFYHDIGDYLTREEKLRRVAQMHDITGVPWQPLHPNSAGDWLTTRSDAFNTLVPLGNKRDGQTQAVFRLYSLGVSTSRDAWVYTFSRTRLVDNVQRLLAFYHTQLGRREDEQDNNPHAISWSDLLRRQATQNVKHYFDEGATRVGLYRPFTKQWLYFSRSLNERVSAQPKLFPDSSVPNKAILVQAPGESRLFSCWMTEVVPDLHTVGATQAFPLYTYDKATQDTVSLFNESRPAQQSAINPRVLDDFRAHYRDPRIQADDLFYYVYGVLHAPEYREQFAADLQKELPRIPYAPDFWAFSRIGRALADLHVGYEQVDPYPLAEELAPGAPADPAARYRVTAMRWGKNAQGRPDRTTLQYNEWITLRDIPPEAFAYQVNGRAPIEWVVDQYRVTPDKDSGIVNDPNAWALETAQDPRYILDLVKRAVRVSLDTQALIRELPPLGLDDVAQP